MSVFGQNAMRSTGRYRPILGCAYLEHKCRYSTHAYIVCLRYLTRRLSSAGPKMSGSIMFHILSLMLSATFNQARTIVPSRDLFTAELLLSTSSTRLSSAGGCAGWAGWGGGGARVILESSNGVEGKRKYIFFNAHSTMTVISASGRKGGEDI